MEKNNVLSPEYVPDELTTPYDVLELPSQGILYPNKQGSIKVEYLTALDETILTSPNIISNNKEILYFAPEMCDKRHKHDHGVDIWAIGVLIYEFLYGNPPSEPSEEEI